MAKKRPGPAAHQIIFSGDAAKVVLFNKRTVRVWVRELPATYHRQVFTHAKQPADITELCCYVPEGASFIGEQPLEREQWPTVEALRYASRFPEVIPPAGYWPVPAGWADNVRPEALLKIFALAKKLNYFAAAATGQEMVAAAEWQAPILLASQEVLGPFVERLSTSLISSLTALSTSTAPISGGSKSKPTPG